MSTDTTKLREALAELDIVNAPITTTEINPYPAALTREDAENIVTILNAVPALLDELDSLREVATKLGDTVVLTSQEYELLEHMLGFDREPRMSRNYYAVCGGTDADVLWAMVPRDLVTCFRSDVTERGTMSYFTATADGVLAFASARLKEARP